MPRKKSLKKTNSVDVGPVTRARSAVQFKVRCPALFPSAAKGGSKLRDVELNLERRTLYRNRIWVIDDFLSEAECNAWISHAQRTGFENVEHSESSEIAFRDNGRIEIFDDDIAARIWRRLNGFIPDGLHAGRPVGCYNKIRLYRYGVGQRFGKHIDESCELEETLSTGITILIYLNDEGLKGGETVFYGDHAGRNVVSCFKPRRGSLLFHGHGLQCLTHEAIAVVEGEKFVLRTDVVYDSQAH